MSTDSLRPFVQTIMSTTRGAKQARSITHLKQWELRPIDYVVSGAKVLDRARGRKWEREAYDSIRT
nr:hypothetical protein Q903MT_gene4541 [Picea sitchensis]